MSVNLNSKVKLNLTIGGFTLPLFEMFEGNADGLIEPTIKSLAKFISLVTDYGHFKSTLKITNDAQFGRLTDTGYSDGVLGMVQTKEVDMAWFPLPYSTPMPPGHYTLPVCEDYYVLNSFPRILTSISQDVIATFKLIQPSTWALVVSVTLIVEVIISWKSSSSSSQLQLSSSFILKAIGQLPCTLFNQYHGDRSVLRTSQVIFLSLFLVIFTAAFNTNTFIGSGDVRINTLRDVVIHDRTPFFYEGLSLFEYFESGVTQDYRDVFEVAKTKGTAYPLTIGDPGKFISLSNEIVLPVLERVGKTGSMVEGTINPLGQYSYWSNKPFHRVSSGFLVNPMENVSDKISRLNQLSSKLLQSSLVEKLSLSIVTDILLSFGHLGLNQWKLIKRDMRSADNHQITQFLPLQLSGLIVIFMCFAGFLLITIIIQLCEIIWYNLRYKLELISSDHEEIQSSVI